ncbi:hypothetical protein Gotur_018728 [Gossypium turneri]
MDCVPFSIPRSSIFLFTNERGNSSQTNFC